MDVFAFNGIDLDEDRRPTKEVRWLGPGPPLALPTGVAPGWPPPVLVLKLELNPFRFRGTALGEKFPFWVPIPKTNIKIKAAANWPPLPEKEGREEVPSGNLPFRPQKVGKPN